MTSLFGLRLSFATRKVISDPSMFPANVVRPSLWVMNVPSRTSEEARSVEAAVSVVRSSREAEGWTHRFRPRCRIAASTASRSTGEATCQFDMPEACATTTSFSRCATFSAAAVAMKRAIGMSREMIWGVASRLAQRKVSIEDRFWTIVS